LSDSEAERCEDARLVLATRVLGVQAVSGEFLDVDDGSFAVRQLHNSRAI
jgi:hypothetical protein